MQNTFKNLQKIIFLVSILTLLTSLQAQITAFGRNKVHYTQFKWLVLRTKHFDIYYYPQMAEVAEKGARFAEESYKILQRKFDYSITRRIPLIFYSSHLHFEQTNITPGFIPEGVGGFFEYMKGRVVIPANGDMKRFKRVIRHELVHVFMHGKLSNVYQRHNVVSPAFPPLWFTEGLAEYWSGGWDSQGEMVLKDAVLNNYIVGLENIQAINGTFMMYKVGQNVLMYISQKYGEDKILSLMENLWKYDHFQQSFKFTLNKDYKTFDQEYLFFLKKKFYPLLAHQSLTVLADPTIVRQGYNFKPCVFRDSTDHKNYVVWVGNRTGYSSIYMRRLSPLAPDEKEKVRTLVKGEASSDFEAFHIFDSKIAVNSSGILAFSSKSGERDALYLFDIYQRKVIDKFYFKNLVGIYSPSWSADGKRIVFSGLSVAGYSDLYLLDLKNRRIRQLTDDFYDDKDPVFSPDGNYIAFSSDRTDFGKQGAENIFLMNLKDESVFYVTYDAARDRTPYFSADGSYLVYSSDRSKTNNLYLIKKPLSVVSGQTHLQTVRLTDYVGSTFDPCWVAADQVLYTTFENGQFQIRAHRIPLQALDNLPSSSDTVTQRPDSLWTYPNIRHSKILSRKPYVRKFSLDFAQAQVSQDPIFGTNGGAQLAFTDMLSNDQYYLLIYNNARVSSDFWKSFNFAVTKLSLGQRVNYALGFYRFAGYYYNPEDAYYYEQMAGGFATLIYPFSQFSRISVSQNFYYSDKDWFFGNRRFAYLNSSFISYVYDNSIWGPTGPMDGQRVNITFGNTYDFAFARVNYLTGLVDVRKYFRLSLRNAYAVRLFSLFNQGTEARQFYFGGSWDLRLYPRWRLHGKRIFLLSQELRFPLIDQLALRLPFGTIAFNRFRGALFIDAGNAWNDHWKGLRGSFGFGIRMNLGGLLVFRFDVGRRTDFKHIQHTTYSQFFFGWDF